MNYQGTSNLRHLRWHAASGTYAATPEISRKEGAPRRFLKGPIPLPWLSTASGLPGKTLSAALCIWYMAGLTASDSVSPGSAIRSKFGIRRQTWYEALARLQKAGLIRTDRRPGKKVSITILREDKQ